MVHVHFLPEPRAIISCNKLFTSGNPRSPKCRLSTYTETYVRVVYRLRKAGLPFAICLSAVYVRVESRGWLAGHERRVAPHRSSQAAGRVGFWWCMAGPKQLALVDLHPRFFSHGHVRTHNHICCFTCITLHYTTATLPGFRIYFSGELQFQLQDMLLKVHVCIGSHG